MRRTVLELTRTSIRLLQADGMGRRLKIRRVAVQVLQAGDDVGVQVEQFLRAQSLGRASLVTAIPRELVITRQLELPTTQPDEVAQMVELASKAQLPYPREQAVIDFQVLAQRAGMTIVQLLACHRHVIERYLEWLRRAGCEPVAVVPNAWGLMLWAANVSLPPEVRDPLMVVNFDADHTDLVVIQQRRVVFSRSVPQGAADWTAGDAVADVLIQELERTLSSFRKDFGDVEINGVVVTGIGVLERWRQLFAQRFTWPVAVVDPLGAWTLPRGHDASGVSLAVGLGLAAGDAGRTVNLLSQEAQQAQQVHRQFRTLAVAFGLWLLVLAGAAGLIGVRVARQRHVVRQLDALRRQFETQTRQTERQTEEVRVMTRALDMRRWMAEACAEALRAVPAEVRLEGLTIERDRGELLVRGHAPSTQQVLEYMRALEASGRWPQVALRYSARRKTPDGWQAEFEILARQDKEDAK